MADGYAARAAAAHRLPPLRSGSRDPLMEAEKISCYVCGGHPGSGSGMAYLFSRWMCRDRVDCYQRFKRGR